MNIDDSPGSPPGERWMRNLLTQVEWEVLTSGLQSIMQDVPVGIEKRRPRH